MKPIQISKNRGLVIAHTQPFKSLFLISLINSFVHQGCVKLIKSYVKLFIIIQNIYISNQFCYFKEQVSTKNIICVNGFHKNKLFTTLITIRDVS